MLEQVSKLLDERTELGGQVDGVQQCVGDRRLVGVVVQDRGQQPQPRRRAGGRGRQVRQVRSVRNAQPERAGAGGGARRAGHAAQSARPGRRAAGGAVACWLTSGNGRFSLVSRSGRQGLAARDGPTSDGRDGEQVLGVPGRLAAGVPQHLVLQLADAGLALEHGLRVEQVVLLRFRLNVEVD